jgi:hypothetical protein
MGIDYSLFFVRSHQRYLDETHAALRLIRKAVFLAAASTIIGFFVLSLASHSLLKNAGFTSLLGIFFAFIGTVCIVPPLLSAIYTHRSKGVLFRRPSSKAHLVRQRYRHTPVLTRLFVHLQLKHDPLYTYLTAAAGSAEHIIDAACGYGIHSAWLQAHLEKATIIAMTTVDEQRNIARYALGPDTKVYNASLGELPVLAGAAHMALLLDAVHTITPEHLSVSFSRLHRCLLPRGKLLVSYAEKGAFPTGLLHRLLFSRAVYQGASLFQHTKSDIISAITEAGFKVISDPPQQTQSGRTWICATARKTNGYSS